VESPADRLRAHLQPLFGLGVGASESGFGRLLAQRRDELEALVKDLVAELGDDDGPAADELLDWLAAHWEDGDFVPLPRHAGGAHPLSWDGRERLLHWATKDLHWVGLPEGRPDLVVRAGPGRIALRIVAVTEDVPHQQKVVAADPPVAEDGDELVVRLALGRAKGKQLVADKKLMAAVRAAAPERWQEALAEHLHPALLRFHRRAGELLVHRDLGATLRTSLHRRIRDGIDLGALGGEDPARLAAAARRVQMLQRVGERVIRWLAGLEDLRRDLWRRMPLVRRRWFAVSLDQLPPDLRLEVAAAPAQQRAWAALHGDVGLPADDTLPADLLSLVAETRHLPADLAARVEAALDPTHSNGLLVHGENRAALRLLRPALRGRVDLAYLDPPYNTGGDGFVYRDRYPEASWLTMMDERLAATIDLLGDAGALFVSIDDHEQAWLHALLEQRLGKGRHQGTLVWKKKAGGASDTNGFATDHEYVSTWANAGFVLQEDVGAAIATKYPHADEHGPYSLERLDKQALGYLPSLDFPIVAPDGRTFVVPHRNPDRKVARWRWSRQTVEARKDELVFRGQHVYTKSRPKSGSQPRSLLVDNRFGRTRKGKSELQELFGDVPVDFPKPTPLLRHLLQVGAPPDALVLDAFAGSGTTGDAALQLQASDGGRRRVVLIEHGEHFETVLLPRLLKRAFRLQHEAGRPTGERGPSVQYEVLQLESFEDALDNLQLHRPAGAERWAGPAWTERLLAREAVDPDRRPEALEAPDGRSRRRRVLGELRTAPVDLRATVEHALGVAVRARLTHPEGAAVIGTVRGERAMLLWGEEAFEALRPDGLDVVYVAGDTDLLRRRRPGERWRVEPLGALLERPAP
jgi:hypothetical protein